MTFFFFFFFLFFFPLTNLVAQSAGIGFVVIQSFLGRVVSGRSEHPQGHMDIFLEVVLREEPNVFEGVELI